MFVGLPHECRGSSAQAVSLLPSQWDEQAVVKVEALALSLGLSHKMAMLQTMGSVAGAQPALARVCMEGVLVLA